MKPAQLYFCEQCQEAIWLRGEIDSRTPCPKCRRPSLVMVENPADGKPISPEIARAAFAKMHDAIAENPEPT